MDTICLGQPATETILPQQTIIVMMDGLCLVALVIIRMEPNVIPITHVHLEVP